jgi:hypothetical protein
VASGGVEGLVAGREMAERVCQILLRPSPEALETCSTLLHATVEHLRSVSVVSGDKQARVEAGRLGFAVRRAAALLRSAAEYHTGWNRWLGVRTGGYQAGGEPAGVVRPGLVCVKG